MHTNTIFVLGVNGATGKWVCQHLLASGLKVKAMVRSAVNLPKSLRDTSGLEIIEASILNILTQQLLDNLKECEGMVCCLGHNMSLKGVFGPQYRLVTNAVRKVCHCINALSPAQPKKVVLMNTSGNRNRDLNEQVSTGEKILLGLLRTLVPPQADNEAAADYLRTTYPHRSDGLSRQTDESQQFIEWVAVRPDGLVDSEQVSAYETHPSPIRSAIFDAGKVSRINVAHFMAQLLLDDPLWQKWKGQMPVIYGAENT